mmetsp:Transcript_26164/g.104669  ORF Transcript_26164/g.104669 Transcript_26164/m.104669 type:complete len:94 (+) Transcript_26164:278-559(+)
MIVHSTALLCLNLSSTQHRFRTIRSLVAIDPRCSVRSLFTLAMCFCDHVKNLHCNRSTTDKNIPKHSAVELRFPIRVVASFKFDIQTQLTSAA